MSAHTPEQSPFSFVGQTAIVTGSTRGIGLAAARLLAASGAQVVISSRKSEACEAVRADFAAQGYDVIAIPAHAAREEDIARLVQETMRQFGRLDVVVANVGINPVFDPLTETAEDSIAKVYETNVLGPLRLARHALPHIAASGGGAMVMTSSINAKVGMAGSSFYGVSKAALEQLVRQLAVEWGPKNVRVNAVAPGTVRTDMVRELAARPGFIDGITRQTPLQRIAEVEDVAGPIAFLASQAARHITGQVLTIDGGQTINRAAN